MMFNYFESLIICRRQIRWLNPQSNKKISFIIILLIRISYRSIRLSSQFNFANLQTLHLTRFILFRTSRWRAALVSLILSFETLSLLSPCIKLSPFPLRFLFLPLFYSLLHLLFSRHYLYYFFPLSSVIMCYVQCSLREEKETQKGRTGGGMRGVNSTPRSNCTLLHFSRAQPTSSYCACNYVDIFVACHHREKIGGGRKNVLALSLVPFSLAKRRPYSNGTKWQPPWRNMGGCWNTDIRRWFLV